MLTLGLGALALAFPPEPVPARQPPIRTRPLPGGLDQTGCSTSGRVSCEEARDKERKLHRIEMSEIQQARTNANTEYQIARRNCSDAECNRRVHEEQKARLQDIANRQTVENARHKNTMRKIAEVEQQFARELQDALTRALRRAALSARR